MWLSAEGVVSNALHLQAGRHIASPGTRVLVHWAYCGGIQRMVGGFILVRVFAGNHMVCCAGPSVCARKHGGFVWAPLATQARGCLRRSCGWTRASGGRSFDDPSG